MAKRGRPSLPPEKKRKKTPVWLLPDKLEELQKRAAQCGVSEGEMIELMLGMTN